MSASTLLIVMVGVGIVIALCISVFMSYQSTQRLIKDNSRLLEVLTRQQDNPPASRQHDVPASGVPREMSDASLMAWVDARMDETQLFRRSDLDLKTVAQEFGLTQRRLQAAAKSQYGSFPDYLTKKRLDLACQMLRHKPYYTVDSISQDAGFKARRTFQTLFKARIGMTPSQYRERSNFA